LNKSDENSPKGDERNDRVQSNATDKMVDRIPLRDSSTKRVHLQDSKFDKLMEVLSMAKLELETKTIMSMAIINTISYSIAFITITN